MRSRFRRVAGWILVFGVATGCADDESRRGGPMNDAQATMVMKQVAQSYVKAVLALGQHDEDYVDAYYGPDAWAEEARNAERSLDRIREEAQAQAAALNSVGRPASGLSQLRFDYLSTQLRALIARTAMLAGEHATFDEESRSLYDAVAPRHSEETFRGVLEEMDALLPGDGSLHDRYVAFRSQFEIPRERVDDVFQAAIAACRERTARYVSLPEDETFVVEYVTEKPWSGYNWYQGGFRSVIQVNVDFPIYIDRALDLACHEGYPGHHAYNALLERHLTRARGWVEFSVYPLFSPQSLIAEGSANYGIEVAFPGQERLAFERDTLFALAGLDPAGAAEFRAVMELADRLSYAGNHAARRYLDGEIGREEAAEWLARYALMPLARAEQRVDFFERYRSYVINYNLGRDVVRDYVERELDGASPAARWARFADLLSSPRLPSGLR